MNGINEHGSFEKTTYNMMFDKVCQSIVLQNSMLPLLRKILATGLQSAMKILSFFDLLLALLSDISQAKKAQERQADMQVDATCYVLMCYL